MGRGFDSLPSHQVRKAAVIQIIGSNVTDMGGRKRYDGLALINLGR